MKWFAFFLVAAVVAVFGFVLSSPGDSPEPGGQGPRVERSGRPAARREAPSVIGPEDLLRDEEVEKPVEKADPAEPAPPQAEDEPGQYAFMKSLSPETRSRLEEQGMQVTVSGFLEALRYTPGDESIEQITQVVITAEQNHRARVAAIDRERIWNMSDPADRLERHRREAQLNAMKKEELYEQLKPHVRGAVFDSAFEEWSGLKDDEEK